jgi:predicted acyltransferase
MVPQISHNANRALALDALRGIAIIGMVFSGVFPHEAPWPAWMFHAQVGPPDFKYTPHIPGISWVDLVFPFFLFAMGAAFPLSLRKKVDSPEYYHLSFWGNARFISVPNVYFDIIKRGALLVFFAIALRHTNPGFLMASKWVNYLSGLIVFGGFFLLFLRFQSLQKSKRYLLRLVGFLGICAVALYHARFTPAEINFFKQDIIILVLANMAVFGSFIWIFTRNNSVIRYGVLAIFAGLWLTKDHADSISAMLFQFHPDLRWVYQFAFLKYLNIIIPGTLLGDLILSFKGSQHRSEYGSKKMWLVFICILLLLVNLIGLFAGEVQLTVMANALLCAMSVWILKDFDTGKELFIRKSFILGVFWLFLGFAFEPLDGGIKKDPSSFSYWFITSGLAFFTYIIFEILLNKQASHWSWKNLVRCGQNPMVAYVAASFFVLPIFYFTRINILFEGMREANVYLGIVKAVVVTSGVVAVTAFTARKKWFWRT